MIQKRPVKKSATRRVLLIAQLEPTDHAQPRIGPPEWAPTDEDRNQVIAMAAAGIPVPIIANLLKVDEDTLRKHCPFELVNGEQMATGKLCSRMFSVGTTATGAAAVDAAKFWLTHKGGWRSQQSLELTGPDGTPIAISAEVGSLTDETRAIRILQLLNKLRATGAGQPPP